MQMQDDPRSQHGVHDTLKPGCTITKGSQSEGNADTNIERSPAGQSLDDKEICQEELETKINMETCNTVRMLDTEIAVYHVQCLKRNMIVKEEENTE